ncbi:MAG: hypothetical protein CVU64_07845 [Deltaproteobacteria bacterium HGW-Deltaproteobacteria-21]|nr:MAG: hypothetical protein CVU64_07845 [Deltaproteobacteria bacterium HGW-Deltaproteobacteria-21]
MSTLDRSSAFYEDPFLCKVKIAKRIWIVSARYCFLILRVDKVVLKDLGTAVVRSCHCWRLRPLIIPILI